jgi:hypothetical protein
MERTFLRRLGFRVLSASYLDARLTALLQKEIEGGFAESTRCAMRLPLDGQADPMSMRNS